MNQKYPVQLSIEDRQYLEKLISAGRSPARMLTRARILLKSDSSENGPAWSYQQITMALEVSEMLVRNVRQRFVEDGLQEALQRKQPEREYKYILDGDAEAHLIALACSQPPAGAQRWTLRLLKKVMVERLYVQTISHETVRMTLKKKNLSLG